MFSILQADLRHSAGIARLNGQLGYPSSKEEVRSRLGRLQESGNDIVFIATLDGSIVGWIHVFYTLRLETGPFCEIGGLVTEELHRGRGIGRALVRRAEHWVREKGCLELRVRSNVVRAGAHRFYTDYGFKETKEQKVFHLLLDSLNA